MLKVRLIPSLLLKNGRCIKTVQFDSFRDTGNPVTSARVYDAQGADELLFLDISASAEERSALLNVVSATAEECFMPLTVGGGVRDFDDVRNLLQAGADKISINTAAVETPGLVAKLADKFGSQCIAVSMDVRQVSQSKYEVFTRRATKPTGLDPLAWAFQVAQSGAGEILITSVDRDGMMTGYDLKLIRSIVNEVDIPVIASGGCGTLQHLVDAVVTGGASAVAAASIFHFTDQSVIKAKTFMRMAGLNVRSI